MAGLALLASTSACGDHRGGSGQSTAATGVAPASGVVLRLEGLRPPPSEEEARAWREALDHYARAWRERWGGSPRTIEVVVHRDRGSIDPVCHAQACALVGGGQATLHVLAGPADDLYALPHELLHETEVQRGIASYMPGAGGNPPGYHWAPAWPEWHAWAEETWRAFRHERDGRDPGGWLVGPVR